MKKIILPIIIMLVIVFGYFIFFFNKEENTNLKKVKVAEVAHSIFYAPQYVAKELGYFEDEGLDVEIILASGADAVAASVISGDVQIGFCGSEQTIYTYNQGSKDYLVNFAALTKKDGSFLVSRKKTDKFKIEDLKGSYIIAGRQGGMPAMTLEWALNQKNITRNDLTFDTSIAFASMGGAFVGGTGDYVSLFEPTATQMEKQGKGHIVASIGELGGTVPYTTYNAKKSYIENNQDVIEKFSKAINKGLKYVHSHNANDIAKLITKEFPDVTINDLTTMVQRYMDIDSWFDNTYISEKDFEHIQEIMKNAGELSKKAPYDKLVITKYSK